MQTRLLQSVPLAILVSAAARRRLAQSSAGQTRSPATTDRHASGDDDGQRGYRLVVRADGRGRAGEEVSISAYRVNFDRDQGFTDVSDWPVTFGFGAGDRAEIFGAWTLVRRIDRDVRPLFISDQATAGGLVNEHPFVRQGWSGNQLGDFWVGAKINLTSQWKQQPVAFARARDDQAADGENRQRGGRDRARRTSRSTRSSARK